jgi:cysteine desulfurase
MAIYLDNHATTRLDSRVLEAMLPWLTEHYGNAGSATHGMGRLAREKVEEARADFAECIGAEPREIVFTSGATESNNLAILGLAARPGRRSAGTLAQGGHVLTLATEHPAVLDPLEHLERAGCTVTRLPVEPQTGPGVPGRVDLAALAAALTPATFLVSVMLANNEIGTLQEIPAIARIVHAQGALLHVDCAQALGRVPVAVDALGADLASFSGHKFHGPKGVGALYVRRRERVVRLEARQFGGGQERGLRSGTLDVPGLVGMAAAAGVAVAGMGEEVPRLESLRNRLWQRLSARIEGIALNGPKLEDRNARLVNNLNVRVPGIDGQSLLATVANVAAAAGDDLAVSSGSACSSESPRPSHVLLALGLGEDLARASLRFGLSRFTQEEEIDRAAALIARGIDQLRNL